jgi:hypothetical protein
VSAGAVSDREPAEPAPAEREVFAELDGGCKLLGADDEAVYLTPGIFGSKTVLRTSMGGETSKVKLDERLAAIGVDDGYVYGCVGKLRGDRCRLAQARTSGGALERLGERGKVTAIAVDGDRMWTAEYVDGEMKLFVGPTSGARRRRWP